MTLIADSSHGGRRFAVFFFIAALLILALGRFLEPVNHAALSVAAPFTAVVTTVSSDVGDTVSSVFQSGQLRSENLVLKKQVGTLLRHNLLLQQQAHENQFLRRMLHYSGLNPHMKLMVANVIGRSPNALDPYVLINRGRRDGLRLGMTVVDQNGYFVGSISDLSGNAAKVLLLISPSSTVGGLDIRSRAGGTVEGEYAGLPVFHYVISSEALRPGDFVVTSGDYNLYPRNILLGQIKRVHHSNVSVFQSADLQPAADLGDLELVQVVRNYVPRVPARLINGH